MADKFEQAMDAIREVFGDKSQSVEDTRISLETLISEIQTLINTLSDD